MQMGEITMVDGTESVWSSVKGGVRGEGVVGPGLVHTLFVIIWRRIWCMRELYPCPNLDCISEGIISRWASGRETCWRRS